MAERVEFHERVRDRASGFEGVVIARAEYAFEEPQVLVSAETRQSAADSRWIAEARVERTEDRAPGFSGG